ncbi:unnamed protein product [Symbiodinium sp. CCMP2592]|nr:unnamed protein product [Symbiodinium sp. CCMP2592]
MKAEQRIKEATLVCSKAAATEMKIRTARKSYDKGTAAGHLVRGLSADIGEGASCRSAIRTARNVVKDIGVTQAREIGGLLPLAGLSQNHSERDSHSLLVKKLMLSLPIPMTETSSDCKSGARDTKHKGLLRLSIRDWARYLLQTNSWHTLAGLRNPDPKREQKIWKAFWENYKLHDPQHWVFKAAEEKKLALENTAAIVLHGDEGRGRRRQAFFVLSWHSCLGRGSTLALRNKSLKKVRKPYLKMGLNLKGHSYTTRFVTGVLPKSLYSDSDQSFFDLLAAAYDDAKLLSTEGVQYGAGERRWMVMLRTTGDWPFLAKAGCLQRTFANAVKSVNQASTGVCHLCEAGFPHAPLEQIGTRRPSWMHTVSASSPFGSWPEAGRILDTHEQLAQHFAYDIFHTFHLGVGRTFLGSVIALLSDLEIGNIDQRFQCLTEKYRTWCASNHRSTIVTKLTKDLITWETTTDYPKGGWYKGALTTNLMEWVESLEGTTTDPLLVSAFEATKSINRCFRILYAEDAFLSADTAKLTGELISRFLRRYEHLVRETYEMECTLFSVPPKIHPLHHFALDLLRAGRAGHPGINPLLWSTQMSEDLVGRPSRLSRRVGTRCVVQRTLQRYLQSAYREWVKAGEILAAVKDRKSQRTLRQFALPSTRTTLGATRSRVVAKYLVYRRMRPHCTERLLFLFSLWAFFYKFADVSSADWDMRLYSAHVSVYCDLRGVDAFLFLDATTKKKAPKAALTHWQRQGWQIKIVPLEKSTRYVSAERLTSKSLKFAPPSWLLSGKWDWLIGYDHDMTINLQKLPEFLSNHDNKPLLMLKWYWRNCDNDAFDCMLWEMDDMLTKRPEYVRSSRKNIEHWKDLMTTMHHAAKPFTPLHYFESCVIFRNLNHERAGDVKTAFERTYNMSHDIQRDQFLVPYYLWRDGLSAELGAMHLSELQQELDFCSVPTKRKRN